MGGVRLYALLTAAILIGGLAAILPLALIGAGVLESSYREYALRDTVANTGLFGLAAAPLLKNGDMAGLERLFQEGRAKSHTRFTLISRDGKVLADSDEKASRMENHLNRPEVAAALAGKLGSDIRQSSTLGDEWIYAAALLDDDVVVRGAVSLAEMNARLDLWWKRVFQGFAFSVVALVVLALALSRLLSRPLEMAAAGAERFATGNLGHRLAVTGSAEMRKLAAALNHMAAELGTRFRMLARQRGEMSAVFDNMAEGLLAVDPDGVVMLINPASERMLGLSRDIGGKKVEEALRGQAGVLDALGEAETASAPIAREIRLVGEGGGEILVSAHALTMREADGGVLGTLLVMRDVTQLRRLETVRRDFVANVSHELRTPVTSIQSSLEALLDGGMDNPESAREFLNMALRNARRMGSIIGNLLLLAGMESGAAKERGEVAVKEVSPVLEEAVGICAEAAEDRRVSLSIDCPAGLTAAMNPRLIVHSLVNIIDNAIKYGPEGGSVAVVASRAGDRVRIAVSDQGPGIAPRYQSRVFERFYRIDGSPRLSEGSGLGLALVKHIAQAQGGDVTLESHIGQGSTFVLSLPVDIKE